MIAEKFRPPSNGPSWLVIQLLERCNLRCNMCYEWGEGGSYLELPQLAELDEDLLLRTLGDCLPARPYVEFFGGEPLLYKGIWKAMDLLRSGGCQLVFPTNGTTLRSHADRLVTSSPTRLWVSLDGPQEINDRQRGRGVYEKAMRGIEEVSRQKRRTGLRYPELGITFLVTPDNYLTIEEFFSNVDLSHLGAVSVELQSYATPEMHRHYSLVAHEVFGVTSTPHAASYVRNPEIFGGVDVDELVRQMLKVRQLCEANDVRFWTRPETVETTTVAAYLAADWQKMNDYHQRCAMPWRYAEISARGAVTTCHTFYDITIGNIHEQSLLEIWQGERAKQVRSHLRKELFAICPSCSRYYSLGGHPVGPQE